MNKRTQISLVSILTLFILAVLVFAPVYAATPTPKATSSAAADAEVEREKLLTKELSLNIPDQTEDPNYPVTFIDPSKQGVEIVVDDKSNAKAPNPFLLPNLAIGEHKIMFKFKNKDLVVRVLTKKLLVTPKAPQFDQTLKTEIVKPNSVTLRGTALPQATILIIINSDKVHKITATTDGKWEFIVPDPVVGANNIISFAIKNGIVSSASKTFSVVFKQTADSNPTGNSTGVTENAVVTFAKRIYENIDANRKEQPAIFYGAISAAAIVILYLIDLRLRKRAAKNRDEKTIAALFGTLQKDGGTIVDAIQSVKDAVTGKKKKKITEEEKTPGASGTAATTQEVIAKPEGKIIEVTTEVSPVAEKKATEKQVSAKKKVAKDKKLEKAVSELIQPLPEVKGPVAEIESTKRKAAEKPTEEIKTPIVEENGSDETEEPEKKILTKEEFLKQFQKGSDKDE